MDVQEKIKYSWLVLIFIMIQACSNEANYASKVVRSDGTKVVDEPNTDNVVKELEPEVPVSKPEIVTETETETELEVITETVKEPIEIKLFLNDQESDTQIIHGSEVNLRVEAAKSNQSLDDHNCFFYATGDLLNPDASSHELKLKSILKDTQYRVNCLKDELISHAEGSVKVLSPHVELLINNSDGEVSVIEEDLLSLSVVSKEGSLEGFSCQFSDLGNIHEIQQSEEFQGSLTALQSTNIQVDCQKGDLISRDSSSIVVDKKPVPIHLIVEIKGNNKKGDLSINIGDSITLTGHVLEGSMDNFDCQFYLESEHNPLDKSGVLSAVVSPDDDASYKLECKNGDYIAQDKLAVKVQKCAEGESQLPDGSCVKSTFDQCEKFVELDLSQNLVNIPSLSSTGICYYKKIITAVNSRDPNHTAADVESDDHSSSKGVRNPWVLGDFSHSFKFAGDRNASLTSDFAGQIDNINSFPIKIDNFLLLEFTNKSNNLVKRMARGSGDSERLINNTRQPIRVKSPTSGAWENVDDFIAYRPWGVTTIPVVDMSPVIEHDVESKLRIRMLDCGGGASTTDVYLIIH